MRESSFQSFPISKGAFAVGVLLVFSTFSLSVAAKVVPVTPSSNHSSLSLTTDESTGYHVSQAKPLKLDLVGPGKLSISVRLNQKGRQPVFQGQLEVRRGQKVFKKVDLKLHRSRVGAYKEDENLSPSLPRLITLQVPAGRQVLSFALKSAKNVSMTLNFTYDTEAFQIARGDVDMVELAPLVSANEEPEKPAGAGAADDIALVPLTPVTPPEEAKRPKLVGGAHAATRPEEKLLTKPPEKVASKPEEKVGAGTDADSMGGDTEIPAPKPVVLPREKVIVVSSAPATEPTHAEAASPSRDAEGSPPLIKKTVRKKKQPLVSIGLKAGQISPFPRKISGTSFTGSLDLRFIMPVFEGRLSLGVEGGYHQFQLNITGQQLKTKTTVIPIGLQLLYRLPLGTVLEPYFGAGADLFLCSAEVQSKSESVLAFGGHVTLGLESKVGPGFVLAELKAGLARASVANLFEDFNPSGILTEVGYRFVF